MSNLILPNALITDLSHWQPPGSIDWVAAKGAGVVGVIVKLIQGGVPDPAHINHLYNAYEAGIPLLGVYDFGDASDDHQAFLNETLAEFQGSAITRILALDAETSARQMTIPEAEDWVDAIQLSQHRFPTLYMGRSGPDGTGRGLPSAVLSHCDLWLPKYGPIPDNSKLPAGFRLPVNDTERGGVCRLWQFTGDGINAPAKWPAGTPAKCDLSYAFFQTMEGLTAWWGT